MPIGPINFTSIRERIINPPPELPIRPHSGPCFISQIRNQDIPPFSFRGVVALNVFPTPSKPEKLDK